MTNDELDEFSEQIQDGSINNYDVEALGKQIEEFNHWWQATQHTDYNSDEKLSQLDAYKILVAIEGFPSKKGEMKTKDWLDTMNFIKKIPVFKVT